MFIYMIYNLICERIHVNICTILAYCVHLMNKTNEELVRRLLDWSDPQPQHVYRTGSHVHPIFFLITLLLGIFFPVVIHRSAMAVIHTKMFVQIFVYSSVLALLSFLGLHLLSDLMFSCFLGCLSLCTFLTTNKKQT